MNNMFSLIIYTYILLSIFIIIGIIFFTISFFKWWSIIAFLFIIYFLIWLGPLKNRIKHPRI